KVAAEHPTEFPEELRRLHRFARLDVQANGERHVFRLGPGDWLACFHRHDRIQCAVSNREGALFPLDVLGWDRRPGLAWFQNRVARKEGLSRVRKNGVAVDGAQPWGGFAEV